jgi:2,4-dienoyl-CoA reductase-like NADH-dependent reductase (Old Yellow Enzyme family)
VSDLFSGTEIGSLTLNNRLIRSATWERMASVEGMATPELIDVMVQLARGGIGLIITGLATINRAGTPGPRHLLACGDDVLTSMISMTTAVHDAGGRIVLQIGHAGGFSEPPQRDARRVGPSALKLSDGLSWRELSSDQIAAIVKDFERASFQSQEAGFDGVQIHAAHGYLLSQFLSPFYNRRRDSYGGNTENRARIVQEILKAIRRSVGKEYPILLKMNSEDFIEGGLSIDEMVKLARLLQDAGVDAIELSGGGPPPAKHLPCRPSRLKPEDEGYYREAAKRFKEDVYLPLMLGGGIRSLGVAERLIAEGLADCLTFCRPLIREPALVNRWKSGDSRPSGCISCNLCYRRLKEGKEFRCWAKRD